MLIGITLMVLIVLMMFSLVLGSGFISELVNVGIDNSAIVNGSVTTYIVTPEDILFSIDTSNLIVAGIAVLVTIIAIAAITGIQVLASGLSPQSVRIIILLTGYTGLWTVLSILAFNLINSIEVFGSIIYITLTIGYVIGVIQNISGGND